MYVCLNHCKPATCIKGFHLLFAQVFLHVPQMIGALDIHEHFDLRGEFHLYTHIPVISKMLRCLMFLLTCVVICFCVSMTGLNIQDSLKRMDIHVL